jgi:poly(A) polymerase
MPATDPKREFAVEVVRKLQQAGFTALWAGGCVRDLLLGHPPDDYDVATSARPDEVRDLFGKNRTLAIGASFGVILVHGSRRAGAGDIEVATFRTEGPYLDGRRPEHVAFATPEEDAFRRDFTINGMFYDPLAEQVLDYVGGRQDLDRHVLRAIGDPRARFTEDKLRMLRAVRMTARFDFAIDPATAMAVREMADEILVVSSERIAQELKKMLVHLRRSAAMRLADELGLLPVILPELVPALTEPGNRRWLRTLSMLDRLEEPSFELALATLFVSAITDPDRAALITSVTWICQRLKLSNRELQRLCWLVQHHGDIEGAPQMRLSQLKRLFAEPGIAELLTLARVAAECGLGKLEPVEFCERTLANTPADEIDPPPLITGNDLIQAGLSPGVRFKELLDAVRDAQLEGTIGTRDEALALAKKIAGGHA